MLELITNDPEGTSPEIKQSLDELVQTGARRMIAAALEAEVEDYLEKFRHLRDEQGHAVVVRNGQAQERTLAMGAGVMKIKAPRIHDRRPEERFTSNILPPYMRRSPRLEEALPVLYLRGLSTSDFQEALPVLLGSDAAGLSASTISRLTSIWQEEHKGWCQRSLVGKDYVYIWVDGIHFNIRLEEDRLACLVVMGVTLDGTKEVIALEEGYRESEESWASLLRDLKRQGMPAPMLAIGDGALGFWAAVRKVFPETQEQRCWVHKIRNVLDKLPKRMQKRAKDILHEIMYAEDRKSAVEEINHFADEYKAKYPKAVDCLLKDHDTLMAFLDFPAEHWIHLRTTNPIESPFATIRSRTRKTKGSGSRKAGLAMAFKLVLCAQDRWRRVNAPQLVALIRAGVVFKDGKQYAPELSEEEDLELLKRIAA